MTDVCSAQGRREYVPRSLVARESAEGQGIGWRAELGRAGKVVVFGRDVGGEMLCDKDIDLEGPQKVFYHSTGLSVQGARGGWIHVLCRRARPHNRRCLRVASHK